MGDMKLYSVEIEISRTFNGKKSIVKGTISLADISFAQCVQQVVLKALQHREYICAEIL